MQSDSRALVLIGNLWYIVAQRLFDKVVEVTQLDKERAEILRSIANRPMDFYAEVEELPGPPTKL